ncbi:hypothetical protein GCM10025858_27730 [Alicyclobacillus sacchari]|nr:hypothetical protein GCM10025858_27730 [Alicyclobacillus sacchari]
MQFPRHLMEQARSFIDQCYTELGKSETEKTQRLEQIEHDLRTTGSYRHTYEELEHGARMAWRNSNRCIGRLFWRSLSVFDARTADTPEAVFNLLRRHIEYATNDGKIRPTITIFRPASEDSEIRIWNHQLIRYAGYQTISNRVVGDPQSVPFTRVCRQLGWTSNQELTTSCQLLFKSAKPFNGLTSHVHLF